MFQFKDVPLYTNSDYLTSNTFSYNGLVLFNGFVKRNTTLKAFELI